MKIKAFTIIEMLISITLFSIIIVFLYDSLDLSSKSNIFFANKVKDISNEQRIKKLFYEDIINSDKLSIKIDKDKNNNTIISMKTKNTFHNSFYNYITYFISKENNLIRIESKIKFNKSKINQNKYKNINIVQKNINSFFVNFKEKKYIQIYLKSKKIKRMYLFLQL